MAKQFTLSKDERLKSRKQIELLFTAGKKFAMSPLRIFYIVNDAQTVTGTNPLLFGVAASSRVFKKAVDRNRIKRLIREAYRLQKNDLLHQLKEQNKQLNVFFIYTGKDLPVYKDVFEKTGQALQKLTDVISK